jgi:hypothetical protein
MLLKINKIILKNFKNATLPVLTDVHSKEVDDKNASLKIP